MSNLAMRPRNYDPTRPLYIVTGCWRGRAPIVPGRGYKVGYGPWEFRTHSLEKTEALIRRWKAIGLQVKVRTTASTNAGAYPRENPITDALLIGLAALSAAGVAGIAYAVTKPAAAAPTSPKVSAASGSEPTVTPTPAPAAPKPSTFSPGQTTIHLGPTVPNPTVTIPAGPFTASLALSGGIGAPTVDDATAFLTADVLTDAQVTQNADGTFSVSATNDGQPIVVTVPVASGGFNAFLSNIVITPLSIPTIVTIPAGPFSATLTLDPASDTAPDSQDSDATDFLTSLGFTSPGVSQNSDGSYNMIATNPGPSFMLHMPVGYSTFQATIADTAALDSSYVVIPQGWFSATLALVSTDGTPFALSDVLTFLTSQKFQTTTSQGFQVTPTQNQDGTFKVAAFNADQPVLYDTQPIVHGSANATFSNVVQLQLEPTVPTVTITGGPDFDATLTFIPPTATEDDATAFLTDQGFQNGIVDDSPNPGQFDVSASIDANADTAMVPQMVAYDSWLVILNFPPIQQAPSGPVPLSVFTMYNGNFTVEMTFDPPTATADDATGFFSGPAFSNLSVDTANSDPSSGSFRVSGTLNTTNGSINLSQPIAYQDWNLNMLLLSGTPAPPTQGRPPPPGPVLPPGPIVQPPAPPLGPPLPPPPSSNIVNIKQGAFTATLTFSPPTAKLQDASQFLTAMGASSVVVNPSTSNPSAGVFNVSGTLKYNALTLAQPIAWGPVTPWKVTITNVSP